MKPRIYKCGQFWVGEHEACRYVFLCHETAVASALQGFSDCTPLSAWLAAGMEPSHA